MATRRARAYGGMTRPSTRTLEARRVDTVVVGFDGGDRSRDALALGAKMASEFGAELVVAVVDEFRLFSTESSTRAERAATLAGILERAAEQLGDQRFEERTIFGSAPECLEVVAADVSADVIAVGSTHRGRLGEVLPGSVGDRLLAGAPCAVAIAPSGYAAAADGALTRIGVGFDGEPESREALFLAEGLARESGGSLRLIAAAPPLEALIPGRISGTAPGYAEFVRTRLAASMTAATAELAPAVEVAKIVVEGDPVDMLQRQSGELDLLLLGSRGYGPMRRAFLGGVAAKVIRGASCPVMVLPRSALLGRRQSRDPLADTVA